MMLTGGDIIKVSTSKGFFKIVGFSEIGAEIDNVMSYTSLGTAQKYWGNLKITLRTFSNLC
jgi:ABC-type lipoprotein release transport system permease subunit